MHRAVPIVLAATLALTGVARAVPPNQRCVFDQSCDDGNPCNGIEYCDHRGQGNHVVGRCAHGEPPVCAGDAGPCRRLACDPSSGACVAQPVGDGTPCDDGNACTSGDACFGGTCVGGNDVCPPPTTSTTAPPPTTTSTTQPLPPPTTTTAPLPPPTTTTRPLPPPTTSTTRPTTTTTTRPPRGPTTTTVRLPAATTTSTGPSPTTTLPPGDGGTRPPRGQCRRQPDGTPCDDDGIACTADVCRAGTCTHEPDDARCAVTDACATAICFPSYPAADAAGCAPGPPNADGAFCDEDLDPCTDDRCTHGVCGHANVADRATCEPVQGVYRHARELVAAVTALQQSAAALPSIAGDLASAHADLSHIVDVLAGRVAADAPGSIEAARRARAALAVTKTLRGHVRAALGSARKAMRVSPATRLSGRDVLRGTRGLLSETRALRRELRQVPHIVSSFVP